MDHVAAKYIAAGLACLGMGATAIGVGSIFGQFLSGALRNPSAAPGQQTLLFIGFALAEVFGIVSMLAMFLLLFFFQ
jgi:F-type H+-transporting ATPase subunit c